MAEAVRLVIFDFDGTLCDSGDWFLSVVDQVAERYRFRTVQQHEIEMLRAIGSREVIRHLGIPAWKLPFISAHMRKLVAQHAHRIPLFPDTSRLLRQISELGYKLALVTSNAEANARAILGPENCARISWWECGSSLYGKARKFRRVLQRSGFVAAETLSIGDETRDIEAARAVGLRSGAVLWGYANRDALARCGPDLLFENADAILEELAPVPA